MIAKYNKLMVALDPDVMAQFHVDPTTSGKGSDSIHAITGGMEFVLELQQKFMQLEQKLTEAQATCDDLRVTIDSQRTQILLLQASDQAYAEASARELAVRLEVQHYREACASVGETDGHGWAETTKELRQQLAARDMMIQWLDTRSMSLDAEITRLQERS